MTRDSAQPDPVASTRTTGPLDDQKMTSLLDAALSHDAPPHAAPPGLSERVLERVPRVGASPAGAWQDNDHDGVLARIGPRRGLAFAAAAAVAAILVLGVLPFLQQADPPGDGSSPNFVMIEWDLETLAAADALGTSDETIESRIDELALHLEYVDASDPWADPDQALLEAAVSEELHRDSDEMYLLF